MASSKDTASATEDQAVRAEEVTSVVDTATERAKQVYDEVDTVAEANEEQSALVSDSDRERTPRAALSDLEASDAEKTAADRTESA